MHLHYNSVSLEYIKPDDYAMINEKLIKRLQGFSGDLPVFFYYKGELFPVNLTTPPDVNPNFLILGSAAIEEDNDKT